jgi:hypothetical protein
MIVSTTIESTGKEHLFSGDVIGNCAAWLLVCDKVAPTGQADGVKEDNLKDIMYSFEVMIWDRYNMMRMQK